MNKVGCRWKTDGVLVWSSALDTGVYARCRRAGMFRHIYLPYTVYLTLINNTGEVRASMEKKPASTGEL